MAIDLMVGLLLACVPIFNKGQDDVIAEYVFMTIFSIWGTVLDTYLFLRVRTKKSNIITKGGMHIRILKTREKLEGEFMNKV
jgi:hypothetical protein